MSNNKASVKYQKVRVADVIEDSPNQEELHPLESRCFWTRLYHYLFHVWVFELLSIWNQESVTADDINNIRKLPKHLTVAYNHQQWMKMYNYRKSKHLSTTTLSMVWAIEKIPMLLSAILTGISSLGVIYLEFNIVRDHLYPIMVTIATTGDSSDNKGKIDLLWDVSKYALLLFIIAIFGCLCRALALTLDSRIVSRVSGCLQYELYRKVLAIDMNEPDKKHVLSLVGADLSMLYGEFEALLEMGPMCLFLEILLVFLLYKIVDNSAFFAFLFMLCMCIFPLLIGARYSKHQTERLKIAAKRVQLISQLISGVRFLKCNASEIALMDKINEYRIAEQKWGQKINADVSSMFLVSLLTPTPTLLVILLVSMGLNKTLTVFTVVGLLMTMPMAQVISKMLPLAIGSFYQTYVAATRMDEFLSKKERVIEAEQLQPILESNDILLQISNGFFTWNSQESTDNFMLKNIDLAVDRGKLIAVIGTIGSGKSSLMHAILGEMKCVSGSINIESNGYGYCSQIAYIRNATLRENIVMDLPWDEQKYKQCIYAACLESDLKQLPFGDLTEIGPEGINVSGGQRMRLCFARTLYRKDEYDLFLFDDPLSSVDIYVGKHMFFNGIKKYLRLKQNGKSALMSVNSHLYLLKYFDEIIILENGAIQLHIETSELFNFRRDLHQKYAHLLPEMTQDSEEKNDICIKEAEIAIACEVQNMEENKLYFSEEKQLIPPGFEVHKDICKHALMNVDIQKEFYSDRNQGTEAVKSNVNCGVVFMVFMTVATFFVPSLLIFCDVWLVIWRENVDDTPTIEDSKWIPIAIEGKSTIWYLSVWVSLSIGIIIITFILLNYVANAILVRASHSIFSKALLNILKCNTLFFDIVPRGQILNVLSSDPNVMDSEFPSNIFYTVVVWSTLFGYFIMIAIITPEILLLCVFFVFPIVYFIYARMKKAYYGLNVLWKASLSPILSLFDESLSGLDSIRAYKLEEYFLGVSRQKIDTVSKYKYYAQSIIAWAELYLNVFLHFCVCVSIVCFGLLLLYFNPNQDLNLLLLSIWWYISFTRTLIGAIHATIHVHSLVLSIQKMLFYCHDGNLDNLYKSQTHKNAKFGEYLREHQLQWPSKGDMKIQKLALKYRKNFEIVLDIDREINIKRGTKLAVCGRTGSGKSSILVSIFRLFEPCVGSNVTIDEINIYDELGLCDIRSNVSIIMQTPMIFTGTLRFNLDPFNEYNDAEIWTALKDVQLFALINNRAAKLQCEVGENGSNFSVGEAQLICFARAILKQTKILFMDEPTSSIDKQTDKVIQNLIRSEKFADTTVICIAHRLQTILDYDDILLLEKGKILEYDKPHNLIRDKTSKFYDLLQVSSLFYKT